MRALTAGLSIRALLAALAAVVLLGLGAASSAHAGTGVLGSFGGEGNDPGQFENPTGVAVNPGTGDVYVSDSRHARINRFDAEGNFELAWGWGVADGSAELQVCTDTCLKGLYGAGAGQFGGGSSGPAKIAVDPDDGSVYAIDAANFRIQKFDADGNFERAWGRGVADGTNEFQVCTTTCVKGLSSTAAGGFRSLSFGDIAVDPTSGNVIVGDSSNMRVQEFTSTGAWVRAFGRDVVTGGSTEFEICTEAAQCKVGVLGTGVGDFGNGQPRAIAVDSNGVIYASDVVTRRIQKFTPSEGTLVPSVFFEAFPMAALALTVDLSDDHLIGGTTEYGTSGYEGTEWDPSGSIAETYYGIGEGTAVVALTWDETSGRGYVLKNNDIVYILGEMEQPSVAAAPVTEITSSTALAHGTVTPNGAPDTNYWFEYRLGEGAWHSTAAAVVPGDGNAHEVEAEIAPPAGLEPGSTYQVRLVAEKPGNDPVLSAPVEFTTLDEAPKVETVGSPYRTATTAQLEARVNPRGEETTYRFEYGPTTAYGSSVPAGGNSAGSGFRSVLASATATALQPGTTYHYRVVATNAAGTSHGEDMTVTTRASDDPLSHGHLPGPPGSDRAYEQVNLPDTGGNPILAAYGFSDDGSRALYQVAGGTPISDNGTLLNQFFAERTSTGWETKRLWPARSEVAGSLWLQPFANSDLSKLFAQNGNPGASHWLLRPGSAPEKKFEATNSELGFYYAASADLSRLIVRLNGPIDPENPVPPGNHQLYDITTGSPSLISQLPDGNVAECGVAAEASAFRLPNNYPRRSTGWVSADGSRVFFPASDPVQNCQDTGMRIYMRDLAAEETVEVAGEPLSGLHCGSAFIKSTADEAFFWSKSRHHSADTEPSRNCGDGGDVYRYDLDSGERECLTCVAGDADVFGTLSNFGAAGRIGVADDGSRVYFTSPNRLVEGEGFEGGENIYRLDVASGELKFVAPSGEVGDIASATDGQAMNRDGSVIIFRAETDSMNDITSGDNGGLLQYYRYDDRNGSLVCVSCPSDGSPGGVILKGAISAEQVGPNLTPLTEAGDFVFGTSVPLVNADQNTPKPSAKPTVGTDIYEWRDGRFLLVTDGTTSWPSEGYFGLPAVAGVSPSGREVFFLAAVQLTPDAIDGFQRLYSARIGGGFEFPSPPPPCPLEVCQGEARGAPDDPFPGSTELRGAGNLAPAKKPRRHGNKCKKQRGAKKRCAKKKCKKQRGGKKRCAKKKNAKKHKRKSAKKSAKKRQNTTGRTH